MARGKQRKESQVDRPGLTDPTAPLDGAELLTAARPVLVLLREDLGRRAEDVAVERALRARYQADKAANRTADSFDDWRDGLLAQVAASWFLSCVFVRTLEDRGLLGQARLAGPGATDSQTLFFQIAPSLTERDYLLFVFRELADLPAARALLDREHALVWQLSPSADAAKELLRLFRTPSADTPAFRFGQPSTRFLGDLYQDLYEDVRKRYALLQTPEFVESFILDRTLEPAIERFGLDDTTLIDPTCGSGHFLLGAVDRLFDHRLRAQPGIDVGQAAHKALDAVFGADINPYAVAIARVRLTLSYLDKARIRRLKDAPVLPLHLVVADSLLHNPQHFQLDLEHQNGQSSAGWRADAFQLEDPAAARDVLHRRYAAVVGNPPYITEKDNAKRETYRAMYPRSAFRSFSLAAPFCERFFQLARDRGSVGQITANSFMKREFGKKLIEEYLPLVNLELIVNSSGAFIPGHATPTVLMFGTHEPPVHREVLAVLAKRGEPSTPPEPANGEVWSSIAAHWRELGFDNEYITIANVDRNKLGAHPWSLGGGGAAALKELIEECGDNTLGQLVEAIGRSTHTGEDAVFFMDRSSALRLGFTKESMVSLVKGEQVRDWYIADDDVSLFPYDPTSAEPVGPRTPAEDRYYWRYRTLLKDRQDFGQKIEARGHKWFEHSMFFPERYRRPLGIAFAFVATHNHFVLDRGGKVFKQTAPVIKLPATATEDDHLALLAYLNSSTACFWMKQVSNCKGMGGNGRGITQDAWHQQYEFDATKLASIPIVSDANRGLVAFARAISELSAATAADSVEAVMELGLDSATALQREFAAREVRMRTRLARAVALQEELDWHIYEAIGLGEFGARPPHSLEELEPGERPFELLMRQRGTGHDWFNLHRIAIAERGAATDSLRKMRLKAIEDDPQLALLESPECKRRWRWPDYNADLLQDLQSFLSEAIESGLRAASAVQSLQAITAALSQVPGARIACEFLWGTTELSRLNALIREDSVAYLACWRFGPSGLGKWEEWKRCWELQREEDRGLLPEPHIPPKYSRGDFADTACWQLRGTLDVAKERFISYPGCESDEDGQPVYGWAGWNQLERAQALASLYQKRKTEEGWTAERLTPMLAGLLELLPWIKQWHNEPDAEFNGLRMGDSYALFLDGECRSLGITHADLEAWRPTTKPPSRKKPAPAPANPTGDTPPKKGRKRKAEPPRTDEHDA